MEKAEGDENKARSIYEKVRLKQLSEEKKDQEKKVGIGCFFFILLFLFFGLCSDSGPDRSPEWDDGRGDGYLAVRGIVMDGQTLHYDKRDALVGIFCKHKSEDYEAGFKAGMDQAKDILE